MAPKRSHALVTGAATGIGQATALLLAERGDEVALHHHAHAKEAELLAKKLSREGGAAFALPGDLRLSKDLDRMAATLDERFPSLETLVLNAGAYPRRHFVDLTDEQFEETLRLNLLAPFALTRRLLPLLEKASPAPAHVVVVASVLAWNGSEHGADYAASKSGLVGLAKSMARELAPSVAVNVVAPGTIDTAIMAHESAQQKAERAAKIPLKRLGRAEDVAKVIAFLTSPGANYMTGTSVHVNGGLRMD